jgi:hypothetical protein
MSTSDSINLSLTASQVIEYALRKINVLAEGQSSTGEAQDRALTELEVMLKEWMPYPAIWRLTESYLTLVADTQGYNLNPRPYRIVDVRYRNTDANDLPMTELTRQEYYDLPDKTSNGTPTSWYFDPQRATTAIYVWPLPSSVTTETLRITHQRRMEDIDDVDNEIDVDQEHLSTVGYNLAARLADDYGRKGPHIDRVIARAEQLKERMMDMDRVEVVRFVPETRYG